MSIEVTTEKQSRALQAIVQAYTVGCRVCGGSGIKRGIISCDRCMGTGNADDHYHPYAEGLSAWLASRGALWPALVWWRWQENPSAETPIWMLDVWHRPRTSDEPQDEYVHALTHNQALAVLEECAGHHWETGVGASGESRKWQSWRERSVYPEFEADSLPELLEAILEAVK